MKGSEQVDEAVGRGKATHCKFSPTPGRETTVLIPSGLRMAGFPTPDSSSS